MATSTPTPMPRRRRSQPRRNANGGGRGGGRDEMAGLKDAGSLVDGDNDDHATSATELISTDFGACNQQGNLEERENKEDSAKKGKGKGKGKGANGRASLTSISTGAETITAANLPANVLPKPEPKPKPTRNPANFITRSELESLLGHTASSASVGFGIGTGEGRGLRSRRRSVRVGASEEGSAVGEEGERSDIESDEGRFSGGEKGKDKSLHEAEYESEGLLGLPGPAKDKVSRATSGVSRTRSGIRLRIDSGLWKKSVEAVQEPSKGTEVVGFEGVDKLVSTSGGGRRSSEIERLREGLPVGFEHEQGTVEEANSKRSSSQNSAHILPSSSSTKSATQRSKSRRSTEVERLREDRPASTEATVGQPLIDGRNLRVSGSKVTNSVVSSRSTESGPQRSTSRRRSEVDSLKEGYPGKPLSNTVEQKNLGSASSKAVVSRSKSRRSSGVQEEDRNPVQSSSHSKPADKIQHQNIDISQSNFARPLKRKSDSFESEEVAFLPRAKSVKFQHQSDPPSLPLHKSRRRKSESEYLLEAQAGTSFQLPVGFEGIGRSLRSVPKSDSQPIGILELETAKKAGVQRVKSTASRAKSRVSLGSDIVETEATVESTVTQAKKAPLKRSVSTSRKASSGSELETALLLPAPELVDIQVEVPQKKASVSRSKSRVISSSFTVDPTISIDRGDIDKGREESIVVEAPAKKSTVSRSRSRVTSSSFKIGVEAETSEQNQDQVAAKKNTVQGESLKGTATSSRTKSSVVSSRSTVDNDPLEGYNEASIQVKSSKVKASVSRTKSRVGLSRSEAVPNLLEITKSAAKVQQGSIKSNQRIEVHDPKVKASTSHKNSGIVSSQSKSDSSVEVEQESTFRKEKGIPKQKPVTTKVNLASAKTIAAPTLPLGPKTLNTRTVSSVRKSSSKSQSQVINIPDKEAVFGAPDLPPNAICITKFLRDEDLKQIMPDLDESVLTRARRRAEGPRGDRLISRRRSSSHRITGTQRVNLVNGPRAVSAVAENPSTNPLPTEPASPSYIQVDTAQADVLPSSNTGESSAKDTSKAKEKEKPLERNIDNVIFGDVTFKAWYPSWYPKEIIGEKGLNGDCKGIVVPDLYVCKRCFGYAKTVVDWVRHTRCCEKEIPGEKVYTHGPDGIWSVWEVDGDVDTLYCQNLSLFAKLFLDNKSVFFDVSGFKYFLLVHTSRLTSATQVVGFFSKEKMSWDNNNLACILVFPPWQRKSLGTLLMGISYAISRREQILGGPEKPISDLGKKGYQRYWGSEIARWLLSVKESDKKKGRGMVTVGDVSQGTWIVAEDCLVVLREMGVVEKAGRGKGTVERVRVDKEAVRKWVAENGVTLERVVDEGGFVEGYACKDLGEGQGDGEEDVVMDG